MPKANRDQSRKLARLSSDCSFLLTHLIRNDSNEAETDDSGKLSSILRISEQKTKGILKGSPTGWYSTCTDAKIY